jgi:2Fe-2S ferredoxin
MANITFVRPDGTQKTVDAAVGDNVMRAAVNAGIEGIIGECGGAMMCATCHCYVDEAWVRQTGDLVDGEEDMLDCAEAEVKPASRLSCQLTVTDELAGLIVHIPEI